MPRHWAIVAGAVIVLFALREAFQDLFHPSQSGSLSDFVARRTFNVLRRWPGILPNAGPLAVVFVILSWVALICFGFALMYWALLDHNFRVEGGEFGGFWTMVYFSLEMVTSLGMGDYTPLATPLRFLAGVEALIGFAILTASVSWIVMIYPALGRMRRLARRASIISRVERETGLSFAGDGAEMALETLGIDVAHMRIDFVHFPIIYYFASNEQTASLPRALPELQRLAQAGAADYNGERIRRAAAALRCALEDLAEILAEFVNSESRDGDAVFQAYARDHGVSGI